MKTVKPILILLILYLSFSNHALGQALTEAQNQSAQELYDFHIKKKKTNNTVAWIVLGSGVAMIVGGYGINMSGGIIDNDSTNNNKGLWLSYLGGAVTVASIPLFISAGKHKRKAKIQLQNGAIGFDHNINYSAVSLTYSF
ncbi:hypothetical protein [Pseudotamlana agarivorans]|uniref:hypothetical protein n=1 Tax=Pseudotamlana agarivorans TaxID=481183 RepID=UPI0008324BCD|nr:hypothetical protein [Tamlana agarivorans]